MLLDIIKEKIKEGIFWTHRLHLVSGCSAVSAGCLNCWMAKEARLRENHPVASVKCLHEGLLTDDKKRFNGTIRFNKDQLLKTVTTGRRAPRAWAVWTDLFHEELWFDHVIHAFTAFKASTDYFIVVTKRPGSTLSDALHGVVKPLNNLLILVTMENQKAADERAGDVRQLAELGFNVGILIEPMLGPVDLEKVGLLNSSMEGPLKWIICGGESGPGARPAHPDWFRSLRDQAAAAGVPFMFKGWGEWAPCRDDHSDFEGQWAADWDLLGCPQSAPLHEWGNHVAMLRCGKKNVQPWLDGAAHLEVPAL